MNAGLAPMLRPSNARERMCPLMSKLNDDKTVTRVPCIAGECALWDWLLPPTVKATVGMEPPKPPTVIFYRDDEGVGKCSLPRRTYAYAEKVVEKARAKMGAP